MHSRARAWAGADCPESARVGKLIETRGGVDQEAATRIERLILYSRIDIALIALIAMDMVLKPGL